MIKIRKKGTFDDANEPVDDRDVSKAADNLGPTDNCQIDGDIKGFGKLLKH